MQSQKAMNEGVDFTIIVKWQDIEKITTHLKYSEDPKWTIIKVTKEKGTKYHKWCKTSRLNWSKYGER